MVKDSSREFLITKFFCASCGSKMLLTYEPDADAKDSYSRNEPTGADCKHSSVFIWPCQNCLQPARKIQAAMKTLLDTMPK